MHLLQKSAFAFLPCVIFAAVLTRWVGTSIFLAIMLTSFIVHEPSCSTPRVQRVDYVFVGVWIIYNTIVVTQLIIVLITSVVVWRLLCLSLAVALAIAVGTLNFQRLHFPFNAPTRVLLHAYIHLCGALGTFLLLFATVGLDVLLI